MENDYRASPNKWEENFKGSATLLPNGKWEILARPEVILIIKRIITRASDHAAGRILVQDSPQTAQDLHWISQRYPLQFTCPTPIEELAKKATERTLALENLLKTGSQKDFPLALPPRPYQKIAAELLTAQGHLLLADEVGLGKTVTSLCALSQKELRPAVVVCPAHLCIQWKSFAARFLPEVGVEIAKTGKPYKLKDSTEILILSYAKLSGWKHHLALEKIQSIIFDEVQELRRPDSQKYRAAKGLAEIIPFKSGLSVHADSILCLQGGPFTHGWIGSIETAFEMLPKSPQKQGEYEIKEATGVLCRKWIEKKKKFGWGPVQAFIKHPSPKSLVDIHCAGQHLLTTEDHSLYGLQPTNTKKREESQPILTSLPTTKLKKGDILAVDTGDNWETTVEKGINLLKALPPHPEKYLEISIKCQTRISLGIKAWEMVNYRRGCGGKGCLPLELYKKQQGKLPNPTKIYLRHGRSHWAKPTVHLSKIAYALGLWIGNGDKEKSGRVNWHCRPTLTHKLTHLLKTQTEWGITFSETPGRNITNIRSSHQILKEVLDIHFPPPTYAHTKQIPTEWIVTWSKAARQQLLEGLIDSDGHKAKKKGGHYRYYTTTSPKIAQGLCQLLTSLNLHGGISISNNTKGGILQSGRQILGIHPRYTVYWSNNKTLKQRFHFPGIREGKINSLTLKKASSPFVYDLQMEGHPSFCTQNILAHNSASPVTNYGGEIFHILEVLSPGRLGTEAEFKREWCSYSFGATKWIVRNPAALGSHLQSEMLTLRRTRKDIQRELPPEISTVHTIPFKPEILKEAESAGLELAKIILEGSFTQQGQAARELDLKLRQATGLAKAPFTAEFARMFLEEKTPVILCGWHHAVYSVWAELLKDHKPAFYTGQETPKEKEESKSRFISGDTNLFILSLRSGLGIDGLQTRCSTILFGELDWSKAFHHQNVGRLLRDGQTETVSSIYLVADGGSDPVVAQILGIKAEQARGITDPYLQPDPANPVTTEAEMHRFKVLAQHLLKKHHGSEK